jgi:tetratricopeptide (TPR) repeat protein/transglutaminase-like putative cysteine protease
MSSKPPLIVLLLVWIALPSAFPQENSAAKPAPAAPQDFSKEAYVFEHLTMRISEESDGTGIRETTGEIKMIADAGVKAFAVLNFTYTSASEVVEIDYVRVRKPDGTVVKTPDYNIQDMPGEVTRTAPLYSDIHEKHVAVKGLGVGDVLEYLVRYRVIKPDVPGQFWLEHYFITRAIAKDERLEISVPAEKYVKVVSPDFKPEIAQEITPKGTRRVYRWTHSNLQLKENDPTELPKRTLPNPDVQVTTFASWEDVGRWYSELQKEPLAVTPAIQAKAAELTKGLATDDEKIHAIYNFVALKFHYIGLDFGIGRYQPHAADDVLDNGYGDCKDKHTLLASLLKAVGIEAWPALIHAQRKLDPEVPSPAQFNHVITVVPSGSQFIWLDTTPEVAPYRLLIATLRDKQALVMPTSKPSLLMTTPKNPPSPQEQEFSAQGKLSADGTFTGHVEQSYTADAAVAMRTVFRQVAQSQWKEAVQRFSYGLNFGGDVSNVKMTPPDELDKPFELSYDYERKKYGDWDNRQIIAPLPPMGIEVTEYSKDQKPQEPVFLGALGKITYRSRMELPPGYLASAPPKCNLKETYAEYNSNTVIEGGVMTTTRELVLKKNEVPLSDWESYRKFGRTVNDDEYNYIHLDGSSAQIVGKADKHEEDNDLTSFELFREGYDALRRQDFRRAEELFRELIAKDPKYKGAHYNLGASLAPQGKTDASLAEYRKEEEVSPENVLSYQASAAMLAWMGRTDDAAQEWRKLLKADPSNREAALSLGNMLMQAEKYAEAADVLESAAKASPDDASLQVALVQPYLKSGAPEKALAHIRKAVELKNDDPGTLNTLAYLLAESKTNLDLAQEYAEKAVAKLDEQAQASSPIDASMNVTYLLSLTWDTLGWVYFRQGDAKRAESFVRASWLLGEESVVAEHLGEIYEKQGKTESALRAYENALAVSSAPSSATIFPSPGRQMAFMSAAQKQTDEIKARYKKLSGKDPTLTEIRRLPNGEWTKTPAEKLRLTREVNLANGAKLSGSAEFAVVLKPGQVESASRLIGDDLDSLAEKLKAAHYPLEFPPASAAILTIRVDVRCHATTACVATLANPVPPAPQRP